MDILFKSKKLRELCHDDALATRALGRQTARKLRARLDDLAAISNLNFAWKLPGHFHPLTRDRVGQYSLELHGGHRLVFEPTEEPLPRLNDGSPDLSKIMAIRIVFIGDYHD